MLEVEAFKGPESPQSVLQYQRVRYDNSKVCIPHIEYRELLLTAELRVRDL